MRHLKYSAVALNIWAVERDGEKVAEIVLSQDQELRLIPLPAVTFCLLDIQNISLFMDTAKDRGLILAQQQKAQRTALRCWPDMSKDARAWALAKVALGESAATEALVDCSQRIKQAL